MAQVRDFEYKQDDTTRRMNSRLIGVVGAGRYRGFTSAAFAANMNLTLEHPTGAVLPEGNVFTDNVGVWVSTQGVVIKETEELVFPIAPNTSAEVRVDLIVAVHVIVDITGGQPAIYTVIKGTPGAGVPELLNPDVSVILGTLTLQGNTTVLAGSGVEYALSPVPKFANDSSLDQLVASNLATLTSRIDELELQGLADVAMPITKQAGQVVMYLGGVWTNVGLLTYLQSQIIKMGKRIEGSATYKTLAGIFSSNAPVVGAIEIATQWSLNNGAEEHGNYIEIDSSNPVQWPAPADVPAGYYDVHTIVSTAKVGTRVELCFISAGTPVVNFVIQAGQDYLGTGIIPGSFILPPIYKKGAAPNAVFVPVVGVSYGLLRRSNGWEILEYA